MSASTGQLLAALIIGLICGPLCMWISTSAILKIMIKMRGVDHVKEMIKAQADEDIDGLTNK